MVAVVTKKRFKQIAGVLVPILLGISVPLMAAILPADRTDLLYHSYEGGGLTVNGPSLLVRKQVSDNTSMSYNFYIDSITSATVDVLTFGSPYTEKRTENDLGVEYLADNTTLSLGVSHSKENDYVAKTATFGISHDLFGDLTTITLGYSHGSDVVKHRTNKDFSEKVRRHNYRLDISQILSKSIVLNLGFAAITEEGYLQNPYRGTLTYDPAEVIPKNNRSGELYPRTRTSNALALRAMYYLPYRAKLHGEVKTFNDTWKITGNMWEVGYTHPIGKQLIFDVHYRAYAQSRASFFYDLVDSSNPREFFGRDKELDAMRSFTTGVALNYEFFNKPWWIFDKGTLNVSLDKIQFEYDGYVDRSKEMDPSLLLIACRVDCPTYAFNAEVFQLYWSLWY